jgi:transmembrane sensor
VSEDSFQHTLSTDAEDVESKAAAWFGRRNFWVWREEDQTEFERWLAQSPSHEIAYWRLVGAWSRTERLSALHRPARAPVASSGVFSPFIRRAVAAFGVASILGAAAWAYLSEPSARIFQTPLGGRQALTFSDGTVVELNTDTVLRARIDSRHRSAELIRGEAYFKIRHDDRDPFVVTAVGHRIVDLGTEFVIRADAGQIRVSLVTGRARIEAAVGSNQPPAMELTPGDVATASATSLSISRKSAVELSNNIAWRRGLLVFKYTPLREAVAEINRYNDEKLVIADASVAGRTIYGTIPTQDVQAFVRVTTGALGLHVEKRGTEFVISR